MSNWKYAIIALAFLLIAIAVFLMVEGKIVGERTIPAAVFSLIMGLTIIIIWNRKYGTLIGSKRS